jgi:hypothetical protein
MAFNIVYLLGSLYVLPGRHVTAQSTTALPPSHEDSELWVANDAQASSILRSASSLGSPQNTEVMGEALSIQLKLPTPTSMDSGAEGFSTTQPISESETLSSNTSGTEAYRTALSSVTLPLLPAVTVAEFNPSQNATSAPKPASRISTSIMTIEQQPTTIYVAQIPPTTSQTLQAEATESESFLERTGVTTRGSSANIAAIGLGAGCGAIVLVVVSVVAMWLLHRHRRSRRGACGQDADVKLERQSG